MGLKKALAFSCLSLTLACAGAAKADDFSFQTINNPGDPAFTQLLGINNSSTIAGYYGDGTIVPNSGFTLVLPNTFTPENFPGSVQTQVVGINNAGETVGFYIDAAGNNNGFTKVAIRNHYCRLYSFSWCLLIALFSMPTTRSS